MINLSPTHWPHPPLVATAPGSCLARVRGLCRATHSLTPTHATPLRRETSVGSSIATGWAGEPYYACCTTETLYVWGDE